MPEEFASGLTHLEGETVAIQADGTLRQPQVVESGRVALGSPALNAKIGLPYWHTIEALPPATSIPSRPAQGSSYRLVRATFRLHETGALSCDFGNGLRDVPFRQFGAKTTFGEPPPNFSGDKQIRSLGWKRSGIEPPWRIEQDEPLPCTVLSVTTELKVST